MKALLWKDYRVNRQVLTVGAILLLAPYCVGVGYVWYEQGLIKSTAVVWANVLAFAAQASLVLSHLTIILLAGHVIAGERRDRSAEFLAYLPPSRSAILTSKSLICVSVLLTIWLVFLMTTEVFVPTLNIESANQQIARFAESRSLLISFGVVLFGMAWMGSAMLESPTYSASIGVATVVVIPFALNTCRATTGRPLHGEEFLSWLRALYFAFGVGGFIFGWVHYVRRVEP